jgi:hypothetical protein
MSIDKACAVCAIVRDIALFVAVAVLPSYLVYVTI